MSMRVIGLSKFFQNYYLRKFETKNRVGQRLRRKEILCAVAIKLIKMIHALIWDKRIFEALVPKVDGAWHLELVVAEERAVFLHRLEGLTDSWSKLDGFSY
jgi:hypothetical protein